MTTLDTKIRPKVTKLINKYGKDATLTVQTSGSYKPSSGEVIDANYSSQSIKVTPPSPFDNSWQSSLTWDGSKAYALVSAESMNDIPPVLGSTLQFASGSAFTVIGVETIWSGELACAYAMQLEK